MAKATDGHHNLTALFVVVLLAWQAYKVGVSLPWLPTKTPERATIQLKARLSLPDSNTGQSAPVRLWALDDTSGGLKILATIQRAGKQQQQQHQH